VSLQEDYLDIEKQNKKHLVNIEVENGLTHLKVKIGWQPPEAGREARRRFSL
jgi:hypothetical protein